MKMHLFGCSADLDGRLLPSLSTDVYCISRDTPVIYYCIFSGSLGRRQHKHVLPRAQTKLQHILIPQLDVPPRRHRVTVHGRPVGALQIDQVGTDPAHAVTELVALLHVAELDGGVLLRAAGVVDGEVDDQPLPPDEPAAALAQLDHLEQVRPLEHVEPPVVPGGGLAGLGRLVVFQHDGRAVRGGDGVALRGETARRGEIGLLFLLRFI